MEVSMKFTALAAATVLALSGAFIAGCGDDNRSATGGGTAASGSSGASGSAGSSGAGGGTPPGGAQKKPAGSSGPGSSGSK
jgi:hypothetical protein